EIRNIVTRQLENWGATCITPDERLISQDYDIFLTDNPSNLTASGLLLSDDESGVREIMMAQGMDERITLEKLQQLKQRA
ncbi:hypothetical protein ACUODJ_58570, partial [Escherichia sp. HC-CC]